MVCSGIPDAYMSWILTYTFVFFSTRTIIPLQDIMVSPRHPLPGLPQLLLAWTSDLHQKLLQVVHHLFLCQTRASQTLWASQTASHSREAMEFHLHGFHREATRVFRLYIGVVDCSSGVPTNAYLVHE